jgi:isopenicillin N synthase-like dioxygenase
MSDVSLSLPAELADEVIPILDFGHYLAGEDGALERLAGELRYAQENIGFYFAINHGVPQGLIDRAHVNLRRFFALPEEEKKKHKNYLPTKSTIYVSSTVNENTQPDLNEMIRFLRERPADHPGTQAGFSSHVVNHWPDEALLPGWQTEMLAYYGAMEALGYQMLPVYARALDLPADYFDGLFDDPAWTTRNQHYPPVAAEDNQFGIAPHRDHGFLTLLPVTEEPGLQIRATTGRWLPANKIDGAIIVNTGEFLNRWSNGRFMATATSCHTTARRSASSGFADPGSPVPTTSRTTPVCSTTMGGSPPAMSAPSMPRASCRSPTGQRTSSNREASGSRRSISRTSPSAIRRFTRPRRSA